MDEQWIRENQLKKWQTWLGIRTLAMMTSNMFPTAVVRSHPAWTTDFMLSGACDKRRNKSQHRHGDLTRTNTMTKQIYCKERQSTFCSTRLNTHDLCMYSCTLYRVQNGHMFVQFVVFNQLVDYAWILLDNFHTFWLLSGICAVIFLFHHCFWKTRMLSKHFISRFHS